MLRRYVLDDILDETPDLVTHEAHALELVAPLAVPTPELLAHDPRGEQTDAPALVISALEGRPAWETLSRHHLAAMAHQFFLKKIGSRLSTCCPISFANLSTGKPPPYK